MENVRLSDGHFGRKMILHRKWSDDLTEIIVREGVAELVVDGHGIRESLDFLEQVPWMKSFMLQDMIIKDISGVHFLTELEYLYMSDYSRKPIDFTKFPHLHECCMEFVKGRSSVGQGPSLRILELQHYCFKDLNPLLPLSNLESLWFSQGSLGDLSGLDAFQNIKELSLILLRNLRDLSPIRDLKNLEKLDLERGKGFERLDSPSTMASLRVLSLPQCGDIESLAPLLSCENLEELIFGGNTTILNGDLTVLFRMPKLKSVCMGNRNTTTSGERTFRCLAIKHLFRSTFSFGGYTLPADGVPP